MKLLVVADTGRYFHPNRPPWPDGLTETELPDAGWPSERTIRLLLCSVLALNLPMFKPSDMPWLEARRDLATRTNRSHVCGLAEAWKPLPAVGASHQSFLLPEQGRTPISSVPMPYQHTADFRFYEELNDFLTPAQRKKTLRYEFNGHPGIKDPIEAFGVPHTEVDLIIANGESVGFDYQLQPGDHISVYPMFESFDISPLMKLRERPLRQTAFIVDVNLGKLARRLRMLGFDAIYDRQYRDGEIAAIASEQHRIVLTRDRRLLFFKCITHGYWVRSTFPDEQVQEILRRFDLYQQIKPFQRCINCNAMLQPVAKEDILDQLEPKTKRYYQVFHRCSGCGKIYWEGSHVENMRRRHLWPIQGKSMLAAGD